MARSPWCSVRARIQCNHCDQNQTRHDLSAVRPRNATSYATSRRIAESQLPPSAPLRYPRSHIEDHWCRFVYELNQTGMRTEAFHEDISVWTDCFGIITQENALERRGPAVRARDEQNSEAGKGDWKPPNRAWDHSFCHLCRHPGTIRD